MKLALTFSIILCFHFQAFAQEKGAAKVIVLKGKVSALIGAKTKALKKGDWLPEGAQVKTEARSFTKLLFIDKSTMNVGPNSQMKIDAFPKEKAGIITLIKGQIRSKVTKNYMQMKKKNKSKLFIKTRTAAMGVRGTDFQVSYSNKTQNTTLVTFEGAVAMAKLTAGAPRVNQAALEKVVSGPKAVMVRRGQFSGASAKSDKTTAPVKISPIQLETLESKAAPGLINEEASSSQKDAAPKKKFRKVIPPGVDAEVVANDGSEMTQSLSGVASVAKVEKAVPTPTSDQAGPKAGTIVHMETGLFISPPEDAAFDPNTQTYEIPKDIAYIDPKSGDLTSPSFEISSSGNWEKKQLPSQRSPADAKSNSGTESVLASGDDSTASSDTDLAPPKLNSAADLPPPPPEVVINQPGSGPGQLTKPDICLPPNCFQPPDIVPGRPPAAVGSGNKTKVIFTPDIQ